MLSIENKLKILTSAAKYDVACATSGDRQHVARKKTPIGGLCHSWTEDGRCISLLKILFSNACSYDCAYCINRRSNCIPRTTFTVEELVQLTMEFYRRNYIEGLFLSSGVIHTPDETMEKLCAVAEKLRQDHRFTGYIHLKIIPGASPELITRAGLVADRISVNIELPSEHSLTQLAPQKAKHSILKPMEWIHYQILRSREERKLYRKAPRFSPAGQSTQLIIGASPEDDYRILKLAESLYLKRGLRRVYYSAYIPVNPLHTLLSQVTNPPLIREHRLYQADWLVRRYGFKVDEILSPDHPNLELTIDPKVQWALHHPEFFPIDVNQADYWELLRVPGIGLRSAKRIIKFRRWHRLTPEDLQKMGVVWKRAQFFIHGSSTYKHTHHLLSSHYHLKKLLEDEKVSSSIYQLTLF